MAIRQSWFAEIALVGHMSNSSHFGIGLLVRAHTTYIIQNGSCGCANRFANVPIGIPAYTLHRQDKSLSPIAVCHLTSTITTHSLVSLAARQRL